MSIRTTSGRRRRVSVDGVAPVDRLADDVEVGLQLEDRAKARAHERLVVGDQHGDRHPPRRYWLPAPATSSRGGMPRSLPRMMPAARGRARIAAVMPVPRAWLDWAIAGALTALGVFMTLGPDGPDGTIVDSIVVAAVTLPVIWRRAAPFVAAAALAAGVVVSAIPTFDQSRCGVAIPAALLILFSLAARCGLRQALGGLALVLAGMVALLLTDPLLDADALFILPLCAGVWWAGRLVRSRNRVAAELAEQSQRLARTREERASLAVEHDRATIAAGLEAAAGRPLRAMVELADAGGWSVDARPEHARETFASIERRGRESLEEMRQMLGKLRGEELDTSPQPGLADLEALLARRARPVPVSSCAPPAGAARCRQGSSWPAIGWSSTPLRRWPCSTSRCATCPMCSSSRSGVSWPTAARPRRRSPRRASASRRTAGASATSAEPARVRAAQPPAGRDRRG